jgi:hypothetical protein
MRAFILVAFVISLSGCAKSPESISASYVSDISYKPLSCQDLGVEFARFDAALTQASNQQEKARENDTIGILLIGVPVSSLSGDGVAPEVARLKGEIEAINRVSSQKRCAM